MKIAIAVTDVKKNGKRDCQGEGAVWCPEGADSWAFKGHVNLTKERVSRQKR